MHVGTYIEVQDASLVESLEPTQRATNCSHPLHCIQSWKGIHQVPSLHQGRHEILAAIFRALFVICENLQRG